MSSTNPRCSFQIRGVIYQSVGCKLLNRPKQTQKRSQAKHIFACSSRYNDLTFYEKKFPLHNPFKYLHFTIHIYLNAALDSLRVKTVTQNTERNRIIGRMRLVKEGF